MSGYDLTQDSNSPSSRFSFAFCGVRRPTIEPDTRPYYSESMVMDKFNAAERDRTEDFNSQLRHFEYEFLQAAQEWKKSEQERYDIFNEAQRKRGEIFNAQETHRSNLFDQAEADRDKTFDGNQQRRSRAFQASLAAHERAFRESLDAFFTKHRWYLQTIKELLSANRPQRTSRGQRMIEAMSTEFSIFLQAEQDTFQANHQRRILLFGPLLSKSQSVCIGN